MKTVKDESYERRKKLRVIYNSEERPKLKVGENEFKVADFSEFDIRFFHRKIETGHWVCGTLTLLCGESIDVKGMVVKKKQDDIYISVDPFIQKEILLREKQHINLNCD